MSCLLSNLSSQEASNFGNLLTGIAALLALLLAIWTALKEIPKWKRQQLVRKQAEVAGKVWSSAIRVIQAMNFLASPFMEITRPEGSSEKPDSKKEWAEEYNRRFNTVINDINAFNLVWNESQVYLSDEINAKLEEVWKTWISTKVDIEMCMRLQGDGAMLEAQPFYENSYGKKGRDKRENLEKELKTLLRPIARMEIAS